MRRALVLVAVMVAAVLAVVPGRALVGATDASWTDGVNARGAVGTTTWATSGSAEGDVLTATLANTVLVIPVVVGPIGPVQQSTATNAAPGPTTSNAASLAVNGLGIPGLATATVGATVAHTSASYAPRSASGEASVANVQAGVSVLGAVGGLAGLNTLLGNLLTVGSTTGVIGATATCPVGSTTTATVTPLANLSLTLLGTNVTLDASAKATVAIDVGIVAKVSATVGIVRTSVTTAPPTDPHAEAGLTAHVDLTVTPLGGLLGVVKLALDIPIVHASCTTDVP